MTTDCRDDIALALGDVSFAGGADKALARDGAGPARDEAALDGDGIAPDGDGAGPAEDGTAPPAVERMGLMEAGDTSAGDDT